MLRFVGREGNKARTIEFLLLGLQFLGVISGVLRFIVYPQYVFRGFSFYPAGVLLCVLLILLKLSLWKFAWGKDKYLFQHLRALDFLLVFTLLLFFSYQSIYAFLFPLIITSITMAYNWEKGKKLLIPSLAVYSAAFLVGYAVGRAAAVEILVFVLLTFAIYIFCWMFIYLAREHENKVNELTQTNVKLDKKVAEFFTLQQLQSAINSIRNSEELLESVNDMIIGIIGPTYSSVVLYNKPESGEDDPSFSLAATNLEEQRQEEFLMVDCSGLWEMLEAARGIMGRTDEPGTFRFQDHRIGSYMVVPLTIKDEKIGMIVVQHLLKSAINEEHLRLLGLVAGHVSIALENTGLYEKMKRLANLDGLTMVYNRMFFQQAIDEEFKKASNQSHVSIAICDADLFKTLNDSYGHIFGDKVLQAIAGLLQTNMRRQDILARYGGEEFVIIFPDTDLDKACVIVERLREEIEAMTIEDKYHSAHVTVSFGVAAYPENGTTPRQVLRAADNALYKAKREGRNCTCKAG